MEFFKKSPPLLKNFFIFLIPLCLGINEANASDLSDIIKQIKERYERFDKEVNDITIFSEMEIGLTKEGLISETKMFKKGKKVRIETKMKIPKLLQMSKEMEAIKTIFIYDGKYSWMVSPLGKKRLSKEEERRYQIEKKHWWEVTLEKAKIIGIEKVDGRDCYLIEIKKQQDYPFTKLWIAKDDLVLVKSQGKGGRGETIIWLHSDFRKVGGGLKMPYKVEVYTDGELLTTSLVKSIEINKGLCGELFDPNKAKIEGLNIEEIIKKVQ
jgi:hypothetical protein